MPSNISWRDGHPSTCVHIAFLSAANSSHARTLARRMLIVSFCQGRLSMCIVFKGISVCTCKLLKRNEF